MEIRFATHADVPGIIMLLRQVGQVHHEGRPDLFRAGAQKYGASQILALLNKSDTPIFVADEDGKVLGYGFCQVKEHTQDPVFCDSTELYIDDICVDARCRRQGIGKAIYDAILLYAKRRGCHNITLNVWSFNESAMQFYARCGMKPQRMYMETVLEKENAGKE